MKKDEQTYEALPIEVKNSALTTKQMGVLNVLYRLSTLEASKANPDGSFFASQALLMEETGYSNNTIIDVRSNFADCGFITTEKGTWEGRRATTYILHKDVIMEWCINHPRIGAVKQRRTNKSAVISAVNKCTDETIQTLREEVKRMKELITAQNQRITALEEALNNGAVIGAVKPNSIGAVIGAVIGKCTTEPDIEKETTNHSVPEGNYREGIYTSPDGEKNDEAVETVGSVCDFQKNRVEGEQSQAEETTPNATANEIDNPKAKVTPEERIKELDNLQLWKMQTLNVDPIEIATELGEILTNEMYESHTYKEAANVGAYLIKYANDIETLNQIEERLLSAHIEKYGHGHPTLDYLFNERRKALTDQTENKAAGSVDDTAEVQTTIDDEKTQQGASQRANQVSGEIPSIPMKEETPQTSENKAAGSVETPQMGKLSTDTDKTRQIRPESPTMAMEKDSTVEKALNQMEKANDMYYNGEDGAASLADQTANNIIRYIPKINTLGKLNWCRFHINRAFEEWGWALESQAAFYLDFINRRLDKREAELKAA